MIDLDRPASQQDLADLLGISRQAVGAIEQRGVARRDMPLGQWVRAYVERLREQAAGRMPADGDIDLVTERAMLARRQRERIELDMRVRTGELVERQAVLDGWAGYIGSCKQKLLGLPARAAGEIAPAGDAPRVEAVLRRLVKEALEDLASQPAASAA